MKKKIFISVTFVSILLLTTLNVLFFSKNLKNFTSISHSNILGIAHADPEVLAKWKDTVYEVCFEDEFYWTTDANNDGKCDGWHYEHVIAYWDACIFGDVLEYCIDPPCSWDYPDGYPGDEDCKD